MVMLYHHDSHHYDSRNDQTYTAFQNLVNSYHFFKHLIIQQR